MANIEFIQKRLNSKKVELEKLEKRLSRILKAEESNYEKNNPYYYSDYDKKLCLKDIKNCKNSIVEYEKDLQVEIEKSNSRDVKIIIDFLNNWKDSIYNYYKKDLESYYLEKQAMLNAFQEYDKNRYSENREESRHYYEEMRESLYCKLNGYKERKPFTNIWGKKDYKDVKIRGGEWEYLKPYIERSNSLDEALTLLNKELEQEKNRKYDFIIERVNKIVGQITDAQGLRISGDGELNGIIVGTRGKASVETIGCAGYNIQIYHFRCYIREVK